MTFNWTPILISYIFGTGCSLVACILNFRVYWRERYRPVFYLSLQWFTVFLFLVVQGLAILFLSVFLFMISFWVSSLFTICTVLLLDHISREKIETKKISSILVVVTLLIAFSFDENAFTLGTLNDGSASIISGGRVRIMSAIALSLQVMWYIYYTTRMHIQAPSTLRRYSGINLVGVLLIGLVGIIYYASGLSVTLPGIQFYIMGIGILMCAYAFSKKPQIAYILPFRVFRLTVIDMNAGIPLFNHFWGAGDDYNKTMIENELFSGMIQGVSLIVQESVGQGDVNEIHMNDGVLILKRELHYPIVCVLAATKASKVLRGALNLFASQFVKEFSRHFEDSSNTQHFNGATRLVSECFPFIPVYD